MLSNQNAERKCFIAEDERFWNSGKDIIHHAVCKDLPVQYEHNGNRYCVLHFPDNQKHKTTNFPIIVGERLQNNELDFSYVYFPDIFSMFGRQCTKPLRCWSTIFNGRVILDKITFIEEVDFRFSIFHQEVNFHSTNFQGEVIFPKTLFKNPANFYSATFHDCIDFDSAIFEKDARFSTSIFQKYAKFQSVKFASEASFYQSRFLDQANFDSVTFNQTAGFSSVEFNKEARFSHASFHGWGEFSGVHFDENVYFSSATFEDRADICFKRTIFNKTVNFDRAIFKGYMNFTGAIGKSVFSETNTLLSLKEARLENPEKLVFHAVRLRPSWFVNVDSRKITFIDINWGNLGEVTTELQCLDTRQIRFENSKHLFKITCRQLATNAENNNRFEQASHFRRMSMQAEDLENPPWKRPLTLHWWYGVLSFYGESWRRALIVLMSILGLFAVYYYFALFQICPRNSDGKSICVTRTMTVGEAFHQSFMVATLQNVEYRKSLTPGEDYMIILEKFSVPLQFALLALAIRRKFMR